jgi:hypothetical protein
MGIENGFEVVTSPQPDGTIVQETFATHAGIRERIMMRVMRTQDQQIRDALIALGWTPPTDPSTPCATNEAMK